MCVNTCETETHAGIIYALHAGDHDFRYIGLTTQTPSHRLSDHRGNARRGQRRPVCDWMRKYGEDNIEMCIIATFTDDDIHLIGDYEKFYIAQYETLVGQGGMNQSVGGEINYGYTRTEEANRKIWETRGSDWKHSEETKKKMSEDRSGEKHFLYGKPRTDEVKQKLREANLGKKHTEEARKKMSESRQGKTHSAETKQKMSEMMKGKPNPGSHKRWHVDRGVVRDDCELCQFASVNHL